MTSRESGQDCNAETPACSGRLHHTALRPCEGGTLVMTSVADSESRQLMRDSHSDHKHLWQFDSRLLGVREWRPHRMLCCSLVALEALIVCEVLFLSRKKGTVRSKTNQVSRGEHQPQMITNVVWNFWV